MLNTTREKFRLIFELSKKQPWIAKKYEALEDLLWNECNDESKRELVLELIDRFVYISHKNYLSLINSLTEKIINEATLTDDTTQLVAMAADASADSSQYLLYDLKPRLEEKGWRKYRQVNVFGKSYQTYKKYQYKHKNIILIDEFIGTGRTVINRVAEIKRVYRDAGVNDISIFVKVLVATKVGISAIKEEGIEVEALKVIKKGISDYYDQSVVQQKKYLMLELEQLLSNEYGTESLPSLGFGQAESLYSRENGNTPNNVFPIFWWPFLRNGKERRVVLVRAMSEL